VDFDSGTLAIEDLQEEEEVVLLGSPHQVQTQANEDDESVVLDHIFNLVVEGGEGEVGVGSVREFNLAGLSRKDLLDHFGLKLFLVFKNINNYNLMFL
jgi:hypothetical protein